MTVAATADGMLLTAGEVLLLLLLQHLQVKRGRSSSSECEEGKKARQCMSLVQGVKKARQKE